MKEKKSLLIMYLAIFSRVQPVLILEKYCNDIYSKMINFISGISSFFTYLTFFASSYTVTILLASFQIVSKHSSFQEL